MIMHKLLCLSVLTVAMTLAAAPVDIVVSTSMLEAAVRDLGLPREQLAITRLVPPGSCPGHFDVSPGIVPILRNAKVLLLHDYQKALTDRIRSLVGDHAGILVVSQQGSLLIPERYGELVSSVGETLAEALPGANGRIAAAKELLTDLLKDMEFTMRKRAEAWRGVPVIASVQQRQFCEWLGFEVVGILPRPEDLSPRELGILTGLQADLVVGNLQSDGDAARVLAARMQRPVAILSNFPDMNGSDSPYRRLLERNLDALDQAWHSRN